MYLEKIIFCNRAPFKQLELNFLEQGVNILTAINGKGKTTIISHIVDALYEMTRPIYKNSFEGIENKFYRVSTSLYNLDDSKFSLVFLRFREDNEIIDYIDCRGKISKEEFSALLPNTIISYDIINQYLQYNNCVKEYSSNCKKELVEKIFENEVITYFPSYRFEYPFYLNDPYKDNIHLNHKEKRGGRLTNPLEVITGLKHLAEWLLDIVLDGEIYTRIFPIKSDNGEIKHIDITPEKLTLNHINTIITQILSSKKLGSLRLGINKRNNSGQRVSIINNEKTALIAPNLFCLSAGEAALLCVFGEILRQADNLKINPDPNQIKGIVLIDEVEKHLHITLQKEILPRLFSLFPCIQFIISSHSPFLSIGLAEIYPRHSQLIDIENDGVAISPQENGIYKEVYDLMISENKRYADNARKLSQTLKDISKPIIITEGKTDWKHLKAALNFFRAKGEFTNIDIDIIEYEFDFGDSKLYNFLSQNKLFSQRFPIIGVFDCDEANGRNIRKEGGCKNLGNNVWGITIDIPPFRSYNNLGISIEFLYQDIDLKKKDENNRRIYLTSEFNENGRLKNDFKIGVKNIHDVKNYIDKTKEKIQDDEVIHIDGNSLALSKEQFALNILNNIHPFNNMDFEAFRPIFSKIQSIIEG